MGRDFKEPCAVVHQEGCELPCGGDYLIRLAAEHNVTAARVAEMLARRDLIKYAATLSDDALDEELQGCADDLLARLGARSAHVAYPYGDADRRVATRAARHFRYGHGTDFGLLRSQGPPMHCPRLDMFYFRAPGAIETWGSSRFRQRLAWIRARRMVRKRLGRSGVGERRVRG